MTEPWPGAEPMRRPPFMTAIVLTKREAFSVCEAVADAERVLLRCGRAPEAARLAAVFEMVEDRLSTGARATPRPSPDPAPGRGPAWVRRQVRSARFSASTTWAQPWRTLGVAGAHPVVSRRRRFETRWDRASDAARPPANRAMRLGGMIGSLVPIVLARAAAVVLAGHRLVVDDVVDPRSARRGRPPPRRRRRPW